MKPTTEDLRAAQALPPAAVHNYLANAGWRPQQTAIEATLWTLADDGDEFEVLLPTDPRLRDFGLRMFDLLQTLEVVENRSVARILADLANTSADMLTFRLLPDGQPGTVPLFNAADALQGVRELLMAATYATTLPRPLLVQGRRPTSVQEFARRIRLTTPQAGSWVIAAQLTIPEAELASSTAAQRPFARRVSLQAHQGVYATLAAAEEALLHENPVEPFLRRAEEGVSANICDALAKLGRNDTPFEVRFSWAQRLPEGVDVVGFRFDREYIRAIRNAGEAMRSSLPDGQVEVTGMVSRLSRDSGDLATVLIDGVVRSRYGEAEQKVSVRLASAPHFTAIEAYRARQPVRMACEVRNGRIAAVLSIEIVLSPYGVGREQNQRRSTEDGWPE